MDILDKVLKFDVRGAPVEYRHLTKTNLPYNYIIFAYNHFTKEIVRHGFFTVPIFEDPDRVLHLDSDKWVEYQLIKHLPPETIFNHFFGEES